MNRYLFTMELRRNALSLMVWMIIIVFLISVTMSVYPVFLQNQSKVMGMLSLIPEAALQFKGISNLTDLLSSIGFYAVNNVIYMMLLGSVFAIVLSSNALLKEEYNRTAEYLLTRPVTRSEVFFSKISVVLINIFLLNLVSSIAGFATIQIFRNGPVNFSSFVILSVYTFLLNILFGATGLFLSVAIKRPRPITTQCIGLVIVLYFIYTISKITESVSKLGYLTPFRFARTDIGSSTYGLDTINLVYFLGLSFLLIALSYRFYMRRDIFT